jgi:peptide/nickel transport system substrate-binding protein
MGLPKRRRQVQFDRNTTTGRDPMRHQTRVAAQLAACWVAAVAAPPARAAATHDTLTIGIAQFPSSLHPNIDALVVRSYAVGFAIRQITAFGPDWKNSCLLCTELPTLENGLARIEDRPDGTKGMAVTIKLKPDLAWGDGVPVTAQDIAFTWKLGSDPGSGFSNANPWDRATSVDVIDDRTAVLHLDRVRTDFNQWDQILPEHVEGAVVARATRPGDYINGTNYNRAPINPGLYDGPYMITGYASGAQIVLEPNPHWAGTKPGFKRIVLRFIENTAALQANLLSGDIDMVAGESIGLSIDQAMALQKQHPDAFHYEFRSSLTYEHIDLKRENPLLADVRVRRALLLAMDRQTLVEKLFHGTQPVAATWVNPLSPYYDASIPVVKFDLAGARALLQEAGWTPGPDGICRNEAGDRLSFELVTTAGNHLRELQAQVLQSNLKNACIDVTIKNEPGRTLFGETLKKRGFTGMAMFAFLSKVTETPLRTLGSLQIPTAANNFGGRNYSGFSNTRMDADIAAAEGELDPARQKVIWADMQRIYADQVPVLPLFHRAEPHVTPTWLRGYAPTGQGDLSSFWAENWHAE